MEQVKKIDLFLKDLRNYRFPDGITHEEMNTTLNEGLSSQKEILRERSLLCIYYLSRMAKSDSKITWSNALWEKGGFEEQGEKIRGRMHWMRLSDLMDEERYDEAKKMLRRIQDEENSLYVWERVFAVVNGNKESYRFYPDLTADILEEDQPDFYLDFKQNQEYFFRFGLSLAKSQEKEFPLMIEKYLTAEIPQERLDGLIRIYGEVGMNNPVNIPELNTRYKDLPQRSRLLYLLWIYIGSLSEESREKVVSPSELGASLITSLSPDIRSLYEEFNLILFEMNQSILDPFSFSPDELLQKLINLLRNPEKVSSLNQAMENDIKGSFMPYFMKWISEKKFNQKSMGNLCELLSLESFYFQNLGATLLLQSLRSGYDLFPFQKRIEEVFKANPDTKNGFASGSDLSEDDLQFYFTGLSYKAFHPEEDDQGEGFMNLGNLTGLLALCQPPNTAFRLKLILDSLEGDLPDKAKKLVIMKTRNSLVSKKTLWIGPMEFPRLEEYFCLLEGIDKKDRDKEAKEIQRELENEYHEKISLSQRDQIKSIFEEKPVSLSSMNQIFKNMGDRNIPGPFLGGADNTPDALAWYVPQNGLDEQDLCFNGIYFHLPRIMKYQQKNKLPLKELLRTIAAHELYHAFIENRVNMLSINQPDYQPHYHGNDNPSWCRLEEAGANKASFIWAEENLSENLMEILKKTLLQPWDKEKGTGLRGYGEYPLILDNPASWVPRILSQGKDHPGVENYIHARNLLVADRSEAPAQFLSETLWPGFLMYIKGGGSIPWFIDFR